MGAIAVLAVSGFALDDSATAESIAPGCGNIQAIGEEAHPW